MWRKYYRSLPNPIKCTFDEFNQHMLEAHNSCIYWIYDKVDKIIPNTAVLEEKQNAYVLIYKTDKKHHYIIEKNGNNEDLHCPDVATITGKFSRLYPIPKVEDYMSKFKYDTTLNDNKEIGYRMCIGTASPIRDSSCKNKIIENCYEYDLVNAYCQFLKEPLPDLSTVKYNTTVKDNQYGFYRMGYTKEGYIKLCMTTNKNIECDFVFDLMESPYIDWCNKHLEQLRTETDEVKKEKIKYDVRVAVGNLQKTNPFWRCTIVDKCSHLINSLLDNNSIYWSTDSIISSVKRDDILNSGYEWKVKHTGTFRIGNHLEHQWNDEIPIINGIQKRYIKWYNYTHDKPFILLKDKLPNIYGSLYVLNKEKHQLELNKELNIYE